MLNLLGMGTTVDDTPSPLSTLWFQCSACLAAAASRCQVLLVESSSPCGAEGVSCQGCLLMVYSLLHLLWSPS
jgi:hypothetical protein